MAKKTTKKQGKASSEGKESTVGQEPSERKIALGKIHGQSISEEMEQSYLDYAMSVIVARALPDVRDGLKPVHRRILYAMWTNGLRASAKFRKSANVVGEVMAKYHPHGDAAIYESMVRLAQDFSMRYRLVNGQGNFGSIDGDSAAAMRYTEAKMTLLSEELLHDIDRDTVDFAANYDGSQQEPTVLPAKIPNLLLNGVTGIAVAMATAVPPHNLTEVLDGTMHLIDNPDADLDGLMEFIKGPDFPTSGVIFNKEDIRSAYATGRGPVTIRGLADIVEEKPGQFRIIITEIPYQVNKTNLLEKIAQLVKDKKIEGVKDLRDESDKDGIRIVIELKKDAYPNKILNQLYKQTQLQQNFPFNMVALIDGIQPRTLTLKQILEEFIKHRQVVVVRRAKFDLAKAKDREHILEGLMMALEQIDKIIAVIKKSKDKDDARDNLMKKFKMTEAQAIAILEMRLQQLANLERLRVEEELKAKRDLIKELEALLKSKVKILKTIKTELEEIREKFGDERRTKIVETAVDSFKQEDLIPDETTLVVMTKSGYIKRIPADTFKTQGRGGKGVIGLTAKAEDMVDQLFTTNTHADILYFTNKGRVFQLKGYDIPTGSRTSKGQSLVNFLQLGPQEKVTAVRALDQDRDNKFLVMVTKQGQIKKTDREQFANVRRSGLIAINLKDDDELEWVKGTSGKDDISIVTALGQAIRFTEKDIRPMGRTAAGVRAIRLKKDDEVVGMDIIFDGKPTPDEQLMIVTENGYGKRSRITEYKVQGRGGSGIKTANVTSKTGHIISAAVLNDKAEQDIIVMSEHGQVIRLEQKGVSVLGRATQGVRLMKFKEANDKVASVTFISE
ncbi:MAG: DNA gyrase subunit A [Proteobacteria bacterium]|nr:DNA gyrase subunit A [Pseudomonadota bacterium]